jgi:methylenetetrahydrofolate--tRNA-(uracil-5-)-methyltransferase
MKKYPKVYFAGQISGVEGYMESAASGLVTAVNLAKKIKGEEPVGFPEFTMIGALSQYISDPFIKDFQPMGANFGVLPPLETKIRDKQERYLELSNRSANWYKQTF